MPNICRPSQHKTLFSRSPATRALKQGLSGLLGAVLVAGCSANLPGQTATLTNLADTATQKPNSTLPAKPVKIAVLLPLAGLDQSAAIAKSMKQAAEMALFEKNAANVQLVVKDDGGTQSGAQAAATHAVAEGADVIVGPLLSRAVPGAALVARQANIPVLALSNDTRVAGNGVYLMSFLIDQEVDRVISFAVSRGKRQIAALIPETQYGQLAESAFRNAMAQHGGVVRVIERYPARANAMLKPAQRIAAALKQANTAGLPIDAVFVPGGQDTLPNLAPILTYAGLTSANTQLLGTGGWDMPNNGRFAALAGGWYAGPDPSAWANFSERFTRTFGHQPPRIASLAYDAVGYAMSLATDSGNSAPFSAGNVTRLNGYVGIDGLVRLTPSGLPERSLAVLEVQKFGPTIADPAPTHVGAPTLSSLAN